MVADLGTSQVMHDFIGFPKGRQGVEVAMNGKIAVVCDSAIRSATSALTHMMNFAKEQGAPEKRYPQDEDDKTGTRLLLQAPTRGPLFYG